MKYTKNLTIMAIACLAISIVHLSKREHSTAQAEPIQTVALGTIDAPEQPGLKTKIFTIIDKSKYTGQSTR